MIEPTNTSQTDTNLNKNPRKANKEDTQNENTGRKNKVGELYIKQGKRTLRKTKTKQRAKWG